MVLTLLCVTKTSQSGKRQLGMQLLALLSVNSAGDISAGYLQIFELVKKELSSRERKILLNCILGLVFKTFGHLFRFIIIKEQPSIKGAQLQFVVSRTP